MSTEGDEDDRGMHPALIQPSDKQRSYQDVDEVNQGYDNESPDDQLLQNHNVNDRFRLVQITMLILGTCTLLPWNFFITANNYWMYKFRKVGSPIDLNNKTTLQATFESYLTVSSTVSLTAFLFLNTFFIHRLQQELRVLGSLLSVTILMAVTTAFVKITTDDWQNDFLIITLVIAVLINAATAIFQGAVGGIASMLPPNCINSLMNGQSLGGVFASTAGVLTLLNPDTSPENSALSYFLVAIVWCCITVVCYYLVRKSVFYRYHTRRHLVLEHHSVSNVSIIAVFKKIWPYCIAAWYVLASTLAVFPAVLANSISQNIDDNTLLTGTLYVPLVIFLLFNVSDCGGRTLSLFVNWPKKGSPFLYILSFLRVIFPILLLFCNRQPRHGLPILFHQDYWLIIFMIFLGLTNGYFLTLSMMYAPMIVNKEEQEITGTMMATFAGTGVMSGTLVGIALVHTV